MNRLFRILRSWRSRLKYPSVYRTTLEGAELRFHTQDPFSRRWFYPRYAGGKLHEESATRLFFHEAKQAQVVVDVGCNLGWFTCVAAKANPKGQVYAFEMDQSNLELCRGNLQLNHLQNVCLEHGAISNKEGMVRYASQDQKPSAQFRMDATASQGNAVRSIRLDDYFANLPAPNLIKIDVEGAELMVLQGMTNILQAGKLHTMLIEIHPHWIRDFGGSVAELVALLDANQFRLSVLQHRSSGASEQPIDVASIENLKSAGEMFVARRSPR